MAGAWTLIGIIFFFKEKKKYGDQFGAHVDIEIEYTEEDLAAIEANW